jgi:short-subunit dehydrogenase
MILHGKKALITGGSSGIGFAIAEAILGKAAKVAITGRRPDVLTEAAKGLRQRVRSVDTIAADVARIRAGTRRSSWRLRSSAASISSSTMLVE